MRSRTILMLALLVFTAGLLTAGEFWEKKPYAKWSENEARQMITKSPWCVVFEWKQPYYSERVEKMASVSERDVRTGGAASSYTKKDEELKEEVGLIRVMLFSARPVRQAYAALAAKGDAARLEKLKDFAESDFGDEITVAWVVEPKLKGKPPSSDLEAELLALTPADVAKDTFLVTDTGRKVAVKDYIPPTATGSGAKFIFPRNLPDGTPLLTGAEKTVSFQSSRIQAKTQKLYLEVTFEIEKLSFHGKLDY